MLHSLVIVALMAPAPAASQADAASVGSQTPAAVAQKDDILEKVDTFIRHARTGSAMIRPRAADRLVRLGMPAARRLLALSGETNADLALMGTSLVEVLGKFELPELRAKLWPAMDDADFPWRPAAARSLAWEPAIPEWPRFRGFLQDPIAPVRLAVLDGLFRISQMEDEDLEASAARRREFITHAIRALSDENDKVRRRAAVLLDARGHGHALRWLVEDLERVDAFFDKPTGLTARYEAMNFLMDRGIEIGEYVPELPTTAPEGTRSNAAALAAIKKAVMGRATAMEAKLPEAVRGLIPAEIPAIAQAGAMVENAVIGLELRSCRRGDFFLRWTEDDQLVIGEGNAARIPLPEGTTKALIAASKSTHEKVGEQVFWGRRGCDIERYCLPRTVGPADLPLLLIVAKDEQPAPGLRPGALTELGAAMAASIPADSDLTAQDVRTRELARRVRECFASIGGAVDR